MIEASKTGSGSAVVSYGMVGGGPGAFIGAVHRTAARFDARAALVAGSFSSNYEKTTQTGRQLGLEEDRLYKSYSEMAKAEAARADGIDFVAIVTPNKLHFDIAKAFLEHGIHVLCDKPLTTTVEEAEELKKLAAGNDALFGLTYTYTGYPMVKHAKDLVASGEIGEIRFVSAEYPQDWLAEPMETQGLKQAEWRTDPAQSGISNCVGDIGTHLENLVSYITGLKITSLSARLDSFVEGRRLDDNASIMLEYEGGAKGLYWLSQVAIGFDNAPRVRIFGTKGSIEFQQEDPNHLIVNALGGPTKTLSRGRDALSARATELSRVPAGHPEGYFEAFSNIYTTFADAVFRKQSGQKVDERTEDYPTLDEGIEGVRFIHRCVESSKQGAAWIDF
ncbi:MAG: Gfo/Idh/MocA family protein [Spirochaetota bacterium]